MTEHLPWTWGGLPPGARLPTVDDLADVCQPGDRPDPTAHTRKPYCARHDAEQRGYCCTRPEGHTGQHVAGTGSYVAAVWNESVLCIFIGAPQW
jgi:hypothetical protein